MNTPYSDNRGMPRAAAGMRHLCCAELPDMVNLCIDFISLILYNQEKM